MEKHKIGAISKITSGLLTSRKLNKVEEIEKGEIYKQLNLKSTIQTGTIDLSEVDEFNSKEKIDSKYITQVDDIIMRLTNPNNSILITEKEKDILITSLFVKIRVDSNIIYPKYLLACLNSSRMRAEIKGKASGTMTQIINIPKIRDIIVEVPSMKKQKQIGELYYNINKKISLLKEQISLNMDIYDSIINEIIKN